MVAAHDDPTGAHASSHGHALSGTDWLDAHFEACRPEYEAMLRSVGLRPGWRVLDAGCGGGGYLPLIAEAVGPTGSLVAIDLDEGNIAAALDRATPLHFPCPVEARAGDVTALPFPDDHFDAAWCANVSQYLDDGELVAALAEFRRVVKSGGLVALKEFAATPWTFGPGDVARLWRVLAATRDTRAMIHGTLRARDARRWLERAGCEAVWQKTTLIERWAPLRPIERRYIGELLAFMAQLAGDAALPAADRAFWRTVADPHAPDHPLDDPEFYWCEASVVAVGRIPHGVA